MRQSLTLQPGFISKILDYLEVETRGASELTGLNQLIQAYTRRVPWESASRIVRKADIAELEARPRDPVAFWEQAIGQGTGGTCFESNLAFSSLLRTQGYETYLTINDMGEQRGCHTAIIVMLAGRYLVDVGMPLYATLPIQANEITRIETAYQHYTVRPMAERRYSIERAPHPKPVCYTLIDEPVAEADYMAATTADYDENGLFLDRVVIARIVGGLEWRFNSAEPPYHLQMFQHGQRYDTPIVGEPCKVIGEHFGIDTEIVRRALELVK
jgi:hypothetical protein